MISTRLVVVYQEFTLAKKRNKLVESFWDHRDPKSFSTWSTSSIVAISKKRSLPRRTMNRVKRKRGRKKMCRRRRSRRLRKSRKRRSRRRKSKLRMMEIKKSRRMLVN